MKSGLQSFGCCPWCGARIRMHRQSDGFACPVCACTFRHRRLTWLIGIPSSVAVAILLFQIVPIGMVAVFAAVALVWLLISRMGIYVVVNEGKEDVTPEEAEEYVPEKKEGRWFIAFLAVLLLVIIGFFVWAMKSI